MVRRRGRVIRLTHNRKMSGRSYCVRLEMLADREPTNEAVRCGCPAVAGNERRCLALRVPFAGQDRVTE